MGISGIGIAQHQQLLSRPQTLRAQSSASEEASESPAEKAAEAAGSGKGTVMDTYA